MRHESRTHKNALDWFFDKNKSGVDILTKDNFTRNEWNNLFQLLNISHFNSICCFQNFNCSSCPETMAKRMQRRKRRREICGKVKTDVELGLICCDKFFDSAKSNCTEKSGETEGTLSSRLKAQGNLWRENLIKAQLRVFKWGKKMQRWTRVRRDLQRQWGTKNFWISLKKTKVKGNSYRLETQTSTVVEQYGHTISIFLLPACHILRKFFRMCDRDTVVNREKIGRSRCKYDYVVLCPLLFKLQFILIKIAQRIYIPPKISPS